MGMLKTVFRRKMCKGTVLVLLSQLLLLVVLDRMYWAVDQEQEPRRLGSLRHGRFRPRRLREGAEHVHENTVIPAEGKPAARQDMLVNPAKLSRRDNPIIHESPDFSEDTERKDVAEVHSADEISDHRLYDGLAQGLRGRRPMNHRSWHRQHTSSLKGTVSEDSSFQGTTRSWQKHEETRIWNNNTDDILFQLKSAEDSLFSTDVGPESDSACAIPDLKAPDDLCWRNVTWRCNMSDTFSTLINRTIHVNCSGLFRVNFLERREHEAPLPSGQYVEYPQWNYFEGPTSVAMETSYADVVCKDKNGNDQHNYHTQFLPDDDINDSQRQKFLETKAKETSWKPLSVLSISLDSVSRAHFHRPCGLPKTSAFLRKLYNGASEGQNGGSLSHHAFLFNRLNAISGSTVMNLTPLYAGQLYDEVDEEKARNRVFAKRVNEWIWEYAGSRGYVTSYGIDNGGGLMGTRTPCMDCHYRPPVLPHQEHGWIKRENEEVSPNVLSGFCEGNHMLHEYIMNYTRDFLRMPHPAKWAAFDLNAHHGYSAESVNQLDDRMVALLQGALSEDPNLVVVHLDLHKTMKSLLHYPQLDSAEGHTADTAINLFTETVPRNRTCEEAGLPTWTCACGLMKQLEKTEWSARHTEMAKFSLHYLNNMHRPETLSRIRKLNRLVTAQTSCMDLTFDRILHVFETRNPGSSAAMRRYQITFTAVEGPSLWELVIDDAFHIQQIKQLSLYRKYEECWDRRVVLQYCICKHFGPGEP
ncbi:Hypp6963 [Branchiostoma lanceolatum]|uniref:Hypp6963 protein n=1 Tax=Branchiostoma lanceolatum TaxID=7740 RepID=A0A8K0E7W6_BRALA|nr:Hypp6963 [Branchiostoma lanceolatum]